MEVIAWLIKPMILVVNEIIFKIVHHRQREQISKHLYTVWKTMINKISVSRIEIYFKNPPNIKVQHIINLIILAQ